MLKNEVGCIAEKLNSFEKEPDLMNIGIGFKHKNKDTSTLFLNRYTNDNEESISNPHGNFLTEIDIVLSNIIYYNDTVSSTTTTNIKTKHPDEEDTNESYQPDLLNVEKEWNCSNWLWDKQILNYNFFVSHHLSSSELLKKSKSINVCN